MYGLLRFIGRYGAVLLFILFELVSFYLIVNYNRGQRKIFLFSANTLSGEILNRYKGVVEYINLDDVADSLAAENAELHKQIQVKSLQASTQSPRDTVFDLISARVISNSVSLRNNMLTIDKGAKDGLTQGLGVRGKTGPIGVVRQVGPSYSTVQSILNTQTMVSVRLKNGGGFGSLVWDDTNPMLLSIKAMPKHVSVNKGDTVITSGYSYLFPEGLMVGIIERATVPPGSNFYDIKMRLAYDMSSLQYVYIYRNQHISEIDSLINLTNE